MKLSIVIPVYNDRRVALAIESVLAQQHQAQVEIIVIDGGSTDSTLQVLDMYGDQLDVLISEPDNGIFDALNKGIRLATGDVVGLLGADDRYNDPFVFRDVLQALRDPGVDGCYGDLVYVDDNGRAVRYWKSGLYRPMKLYLGWIIPHFTLFLRKSVYERYGYLNTRYSVASDYEYILRLLHCHNVRLTYIRRVILRMTLGGNSNRSFGNIIRGNREAYMAWRSNSLRFGYLVPFLKPAQKLVQFLRRPPVGSSTDDW